MKVWNRITESVREWLAASPRVASTADLDRPMARVSRRFNKDRRLVVLRDDSPLWNTRGWRQEGEKLLGAFRTRLGARVGEIRLTNDGPPEFYILSPPATLLDGVHGACFRARRDKWYFVHMSSQFGRHPDSGIVAIEALLLEALEQEAQ